MIYIDTVENNFISAKYEFNEHVAPNLEGMPYSLDRINNALNDIPSLVSFIKDLENQINIFLNNPE